MFDRDHLADRVGQIDEIVDLVRREVDPVSWEVTDGADIYTQGERLIVVRARARDARLWALEEALRSSGLAAALEAGRSGARVLPRGNPATPRRC